MTSDEKLDLIMSLSFLTYKRVQLEASLARQIYLPENTGSESKEWRAARKITEDLSAIDSEFCRLAKSLLHYSKDMEKKDSEKSDILSSEFFEFED